MKLQWTHLVCEKCWTKFAQGRPAVRVNPTYANIGKCCLCRFLTASGIFIRRDPKECKCRGKCKHG